MKLPTHKILILVFPLLCTLNARSQEHNNMDSLKKTLQGLKKMVTKRGIPAGKNIPGLDNIPGLEHGIPGMVLDSIANFVSPQQFNAMFDKMNKGLAMAKQMGDLNKIQGGYYNLTRLDSTRGNYKQALEHYKLYSLYRDSLAKEQNEKKALQAKMQYEFDKKQAIAKAEQDKKDAEQQRIKNAQYFTIAGLISLLLVISLILFIQWRNNRQKKRANALLQQQNEKIEETLTELKATQSQLIHSEKMASLGELTAGIAHEIQNPLNFVNNFSEINTELIEELTAELATENVTAISIAKDIKENEAKINQHGRRADAIVKGMLQHSRTSTGQKELTDINALADEYLRLAYHGIRSKDSSFNCTLKQDLDETIGKINIIPQDVGRVLLNLYNNAFYAVDEKKKNNPGSYEPTVSVSTKKSMDKVEIWVADNGNGITQKILDKIFQPFFTTKPTGQGTGLGLSLSYDIIKAHGGEIKVETTEGEGTTFIIEIPVG
jgi:two-component system, NtrC family, sensor kinase